MAGLGCIIGVKGIYGFFFKSSSYRGALFFLTGLIIVFFGYPIIGMILETYGLFQLLSLFCHPALLAVTYQALDQLAFKECARFAVFYITGNSVGTSLSVPRANTYKSQTDVRAKTERDDSRNGGRVVLLRPAE
ncbi:unnamed protein product [Echinostoma caproni]|uniref:Vesicle transport protein n=1 Tax=Echinostoma caproni TaxID=27848 RepID=A0A3P8I088_9TREM|nr:unnamed protein product [Echinostoma caproni]